VEPEADGKTLPREIREAALIPTVDPLGQLVTTGAGHARAASDRARVTNQRYDPPAAEAVVGRGTAGTGWPTPIAWVDATTGVVTDAGSRLCTTAPPDHPLRIVHTDLFGCGPTADGNWDAPTLLYAVGEHADTLTAAGHGGAAVVNQHGGLSWQPRSSRRGDVYVHVADRARLAEHIDGLLLLGVPPA
jgi:hypothetical protein